MNENKKMVKVTNRSGGIVVYNVPELNIRRQFSPREMKVVTYDELVQLSYQEGGRALIYHYLLLEDADVLHEVTNCQEEPEYWLTAEMIPGWLNTCSLEQFVDALNFAPQGVKELIKDYSVSLPLNDVQKRRKVFEILDFDVDSAVKAKEAEAEGEEANKEVVRIAAPVPGNAKRTTQPTYKVIKNDTNK